MSDMIWGGVLSALIISLLCGLALFFEKPNEADNSCHRRCGVAHWAIIKNECWCKHE